MGAIAGIIQGDGRDVGPPVLRRIVDAATQRPGDPPRLWLDGPAGMGATPEAALHYRPGTQEPDIATCFDGRLDNREDLLALLRRHGIDLRPAADSHIVTALFGLLGDRLLPELVGDFALAIWQKSAQRLLCARSATGWRPLVWTRQGASFAFATEPRALILGLGLDRTPNQALLGEILSARIVSETDTLWQDIFRLAPGHALSFENGRIATWRWYDEAYEDLSRLSDAEHIERFNALFDQALASCLSSDAPVAAHLSGGLDSSAVVCRATELYRAGRVDRQVGAISARYPGEPHDESQWSTLVERHLGIAARTVGDVPYDIEASRAWCADTLHLPMRPNTSGPNQAACALMESLGERVLLTGEGGDDWMNGSNAHWPDLLLSGRIGALMREGFSHGPGGSVATDLRRILSQSIGPIVSGRRRRRLVRPFIDPDAPAPPWIAPEWAARLGLSDRWSEAPQRGNLRGFSQRRRYAAIAPAHREIIFEPIQASAAHHGVELRHPFHDLRLIRFFMGVSANMLDRDGERKHLLREAMRGTLPEPVRTRRDKAHFAAPVIDAVAAYFAQQAPADMVAARLGWIDGTVIGRLFDEHRLWRTSGLAGPSPNRFLPGIWFCVAVDIWLENACRLDP